MINPTDPPTDQPIQTYHQLITAHRSKPSSPIHANPTSKIQNPGDGDEASEMRKQMEKQRRKREKRTKIMREMRDRGERVRDNIYIYIYIVELHCSSIAKKFAIL